MAPRFAMERKTALERKTKTKNYAGIHPPVPNTIVEILVSALSTEIYVMVLTTVGIDRMKKMKLVCKVILIFVPIFPFSTVIIWR